MAQPCEGDEEEGSFLKIIIDPSFENTKAECVYNKLKNLSTGFIEAIQKFDGKFPVSHLKFAMDDLGSKVAGQSRPPIDLGNGPVSPDYVITIVLNNNANSKAGVHYRPNLLVAKTIGHEVIHAEMFRKLMSLTQESDFDGFNRQEIINLLSNGDYPGIYDYYRTYKTNWSHQQMANHYRETIADMLEDHDNHSHTYDFYMDLAWEGLMYDSISTWSNKSEKEKKRIKNVILNYIDNNKYQDCQQ